LDVTLVILSAGSSTRFNSTIKKQWIRVGTKPLWKFVADRFNQFYNFKQTIITANKDDVKLYKLLSDYHIVQGGQTRHHSLKNAIAQVDTDYLLVTDVARACVSKDIVINLIKNIKDNDCVVPYLTPVDTIVYKTTTIDRDDVKLIQTPQLSKTSTLKKALEVGEFTDDRGAIEAINGKIKF
jgi:2-C-methyl-D-erythritol 4-phosphate cytidylyltransferase/2-C-methyl-D-erythritol 2,4-cyclodiphosphate synthase